jgi:hypothetical protein
MLFSELLLQAFNEIYMFSFLGFFMFNFSQCSLKDNILDLKGRAKQEDGQHL